MFLYDIEPLQNAGGKLLIGLMLGLVLNVQNRRQVAILQFGMTDKKLCLLLGGRIDAIEMIGTTRETIFTGLMEIVLKVLVNTRGTLSGLNHDKANGCLVDESSFTEFIPVNASLVVADVDAVDFVAVGIVDLTIEGTPAKAERTNKDIVEEKDIDSDNGNTAYPPRPTGEVLQETNKDIRTSVGNMSRAVS